MKNSFFVLAAFALSASAQAQISPLPPKLTCPMGSTVLEVYSQEGEASILVKNPMGQYAYKGTYEPVSSDFFSKSYVYTVHNGRYPLLFSLTHSERCGRGGCDGGSFRAIVGGDQTVPCSVASDDHENGF